jgi:hypothetical protein
VQINKAEKLPKTKEAIFIFVGFIIIVLSLYPYWIYGNFSSLGWYDEYYAIIPWYYNLAKLNDPSDFLYGYGGGAGGFQLTQTEYISGQEFFLNFSPLWIGLLIYRVLSLFLTFLGFYIFSKFIIKNNSYSSLLLSLFPLYISIEIYTTTFAGWGWHHAAIIWFVIITLVKFKNNFYDTILVTSFIIITVINTKILYLLPCLFFFYIFIRISFRSLLFFDKRAIIIFIILSICMLINSLPVFIGILEVKEYSARFTKVLMNHNQINYFDFFKGFFLRDHHRVIFYSYILITFLLLIYKKYSFIFKIIFFSFVLYPLLDFCSKIINLPLVSNYRWDILVGLSIFILSVSFIYLEKNKYDNVNNKIKILNFIISFSLLPLLFIAIMFSINRLTTTTIKNFNYNGGIGMINFYKNINELSYTKNKFRFISGDYETLPSIPTFYNLDTFDGQVHHFSIRRHYYTAYSMYKKPKERQHTHLHLFNNFPNDYNIKAFKRANIKFINYKKPINDPSLFFVSKYDGKTTDDQSVVNPLYVYNFKNVTPRIFIANKLFVSNNSYTDQKFYLELDKLDLQDVLIAKEDRKNDYKYKINKNIKIKEEKFYENKLIIKLKGTGDGFLVFNQVYTPNWTAKCGDKILDIVPVNGIMMGVSINIDECNEIIFQFNVIRNARSIFQFAK